MYYPFSPSTAQAPSRTEILLPAFSYTVSWAGVSDLLATWSVGNTTEVSLKLPIDAPNDSFVLCVSWTEGLDTYRFKLWDGGVLHYPLYNGERIGTSAKIEVWSAGSSDAELDEDFTLYSSWLSEPEVCTCTCDDTAALVIETTEELTPGEDVESVGDNLAIQGYVELRAITGYVNNQLEYLEFGNAVGDGLGGNFVFDSSDGTTDDDVDHIKPDDISGATYGRWVRQNNPN